MDSYHIHQNFKARQGPRSGLLRRPPFGAGNFPAGPAIFWRSADDLLNDSFQTLISCISEEILFELLSSKSTLYEVLIQRGKDLFHGLVSHELDLVEDLLVALLRNCSLLGVAAAGRLAEKLLEDVLKVQVAAPAKAERERKGNGVSVVDLGKRVSVKRGLDVSADDAGEAVEGEHCASPVPQPVMT